MIESFSTTNSSENQTNISGSYYYPQTYDCSNQQYYYPSVNNSYNLDSTYYQQPSVYPSDGYNYYYNANSNVNYDYYNRSTSQIPIGPTVSPINSSANVSSSSSYLSDNSATSSPTIETLSSKPKAKKTKQASSNILSTPISVPQEIAASNDSSTVSVKLSNSGLWDRFNKHTTEMIITKQGRRMFPILQFQLFGLERDKKYNVFVDVIEVDQNIWKFQGNRWMPCGSATNSNDEKTDSSKRSHGIYLHPDSPNTGEHWMKNEIGFSKIKLTNNRSSPIENHLVLNSMHKYMPRLHICLADDARSIRTFTFPETKFIAVTAYQNADITQLKIENNPFAKGFRDNPERSYENSLLVSSNQYPQVDMSYGSTQQQYYQHYPQLVPSTANKSVANLESESFMIDKRNMATSSPTYVNYGAQKRPCSYDDDLVTSEPAKRSFVYSDNSSKNIIQNF